MKRRATLCLLTLIAAAARAQTPPATAAAAIERFRLEPVLARYYASKIGLTREQLQFVESELADTSRGYAPLQAQLERELAGLAALTERPSATEQEVSAQLDRVLEAERAIKRLNLLCSLRVRRQLSPAQVAQLRLLDVPPPPPPPRPRDAAPPAHAPPVGRPGTRP